MSEDPLEGYATVPDLPFSASAEKAIIGSMLQDATAINDAIEVLVAQDLFLTSHQRIFEVISELAETGNHVDTETVLNELRRRRELDSVGGLGYVLELVEGIPRNFSVAAYCKIVKEKSILRSLLSLAETLRARAADQAESSSEILEDIEEQILELSQAGASQGFSTILDAVKEAGGLEGYVEKICDPVKMTGLSTGLIDIDKVWGGMKKKELIIIAARPSMGKTGLLLCIAANVVIADPEAVVALFSLEMAKDSLFRRLLASQAMVNVRKAIEGWLSREERTRLGSTLIRVADKHLEIDDTSTMTITQMRAKARRLKQQMGRLDLIGVDYLQLMSGNKKYGNRQEEIASISRGLKALAKELDVPVVSLAQLSRGAEQRAGDKRPMLSDLRESGQIEQDGDIVAFIHRLEYYAAHDDPDVERGVAEIITAKNREGPTSTTKVAYLADYTLFTNLANTPLKV